jgi:pimeloyl-ACP methyl ester carboxylesterase
MALPVPDRSLRVPTRLREHTVEIAVHDWGVRSNARVIVCAHGLSRNGRDFDVFAPAMCARFSDVRVLSFDVPGRGESDWLPEVSDYVIPTYAELLAQALVSLGVTTFDWVGTSMGGLIGLVLALRKDLTVRKMVINDVGPKLERAALERIGTYMRAKPPEFETYEALFAAAQFALAPFGPLTNEQKQHLVRTSCVKSTYGANSGECWRFNSDPKIAQAFVDALSAPEVDLWPLWSALPCPVLILRGEHSDLLSQSTAHKMLATHPRALLHTVADTGHAPMLMDAPTIARVAEFLAV